MYANIISSCLRFIVKRGKLVSENTAHHRSSPLTMALQLRLGDLQQLHPAPVQYVPS